MNEPQTSTKRSRTTSPLPYSWMARQQQPEVPRVIRLRDGSELWLRQLRATDRERLQAFFDSCSPEARRYRFLSPIKSITDGLLDSLVNVDGRQHVALILTRRLGDKELIVAEGRFVVCDEQPAAADLSFLIADDMRRRGLATLLLDELMAIASCHGLRHFRADVLADNWPMLSLLRKTGLSGPSRVSQGVIHLEIPVRGRETLAWPDVA